MAGRPPKAGLDFSRWDTSIFDNDPKIDKLIDAQGCVGFTIYFFLCQKAYGSNGYFYPWCFDESATTARKIGGGASAKSVEETVRLCFRVGLLSGELYEKWKILTSRGIQRGYVPVALNRTDRKVISEYWLLSDAESEGLVKAALKPVEMRISTPHNSIMTPRNTHFSDSIVEKSIVKNSIEENSIDTPLTPLAGGKEKTREKTAKEQLREVWDGFALPPAIEKSLTAWIKYKTERRNNYKPQGIHSLLTQALKNTEKHGEAAVVELIEISMANNWQGIAWDRLKQTAHGGHGQKQDPFLEQARRAYDAIRNNK